MAEDNGKEERKKRRAEKRKNRDLIGRPFSDTRKASRKSGLLEESKKVKKQEKAAVKAEKDAEKIGKPKTSFNKKQYKGRIKAAQKATKDKRGRLFSETRKENREAGLFKDERKDRGYGRAAKRKAKKKEKFNDSLAGSDQQLKDDAAKREHGGNNWGGKGINPEWTPEWTEEYDAAADAATKAHEEDIKQKQDLQKFEENVNDASNTLGAGDPPPGTVLRQEIEREQGLVDEDKKKYEEGISNDGTGTGYTGKADLGKIAAGGDGPYTPPEEEYGAFIDDHHAYYSKKKKQSAMAPIEKMELSYYYPPQAGGDYVKAPWTGAYIGSRTMVAGGALMPVGLADARARAIAAKAKTKAEDADKAMALPDTYVMYNDQYKDVGMDYFSKWEKLAAENNIEMSELMSGRTQLSQEFLRGLNGLKANGKMVDHIATQAQAIKDDMSDAKTNNYYPPEVIKAVEEWLTGSHELEDLFRGDDMGKERMKKIYNNLRGFKNFTDVADVKIKHWAENPNKMPLNVSDEGITPGEWAANLSEAVNKNKDEKDYDVYRSATEAYVDFDAVKAVVEEMYNNNDFYTGVGAEEKKDRILGGIKYTINSLTSQVDIEAKYQANKEAYRARTRSQAAIKRREFEMRAADRAGIWDDQNSHQKKMNGQFNNILASTPKGAARDRLIAEQIMSKGGVPFDMGGIMTSSIPESGEHRYSGSARTSKILLDNNKMVSIPAALAYYTREASRLSSGDAGYQAAQNRVKDMKYISTQESVDIRSTNRYSSFGRYNKAKNEITPLQNASGAVDESEIINMAHITGPADIVGPPIAGKKEVRPSTVIVVQTHNVSSESGRRALQSAGAKGEERTNYYRGDETYIIKQGSSSSGPR